MTSPVGAARVRTASRGVRLVTDAIEVVVLPDEGADVYAFVDRVTGVDVLFKPPWPRPEPTPLPDGTVLDEAGWLERYHGGWQLLLPHAGAPREVAGIRRGYHGEASVLPWTVSQRSDTTLVASIDLAGAPLRITRAFDVHDATLAVHTDVENLGADVVPVTWVEHPAFGRPFVDQHAVLETGARSVLADADDPGALLAPDVLSSPTRAVTRDGGWVDLRTVPATPRKVFAALTDFDEGYYAITSPTAGFGVRVEWDLAMFPHAWFWQELHGTQGFPWFGEAYAFAVEPSNVVPGGAGTTDPVRAAPPLLAGGSRWSTTVRMSRIG